LSTTTGLIGEYLAAASIMERGWRVSMAQQDKVDLVAWYDDEFLRVQVKSASLIKARHHQTAGYHFQLASGNGTTKAKTLPTVQDYDILLLCAVNSRRCVAFATEQVNQQSKRVKASYFEKPDIEADSWDRAVQIVRERNSR